MSMEKQTFDRKKELINLVTQASNSAWEARVILKNAPMRQMPRPLRPYIKTLREALEYEKPILESLCEVVKKDGKEYEDETKRLLALARKCHDSINKLRDEYREVYDVEMKRLNSKLKKAALKAA